MGRIERAPPLSGRHGDPSLTWTEKVSLCDRSTRCVVSCRPAANRAEADSSPRWFTRTTEVSDRETIYRQRSSWAKPWVSVGLPHDDDDDDDERRERGTGNGERGTTSAEITGNRRTKTWRSAARRPSTPRCFLSTLGRRPGSFGPGGARVDRVLGALGPFPMGEGGHVRRPTRLRAGRVAASDWHAPLLADDLGRRGDAERRNLDLGRSCEWVDSVFLPFRRWVPAACLYILADVSLGDRVVSCAMILPLLSVHSESSMVTVPLMCSWRTRMRTGHRLPFAAVRGSYCVIAVGFANECSPRFCVSRCSRLPGRTNVWPFVWPNPSPFPVHGGKSLVTIS